MKKCVNGEMVGMTPEEVAEWSKEVTEQTPTDSERIAALESAMLAMMGGGKNV